MYVILLDIHSLLPTSTSRCAVKRWINNTCQLKFQSRVFAWAIVGIKSISDNMISDNIEITSHCKPCLPLAVKQLINNACQACLVWQVCLLVITLKRNLCVCVCVYIYIYIYKFLPVKKFIYLPHTCWHHEFETTGSTFSRMTKMIRILREFYANTWPWLIRWA